ncbi:HopJ type III effector protein [Flavobacterium franklandianum]|uniref:HopJ type III effector protein n=1 Tax=Flavobacterium franklandianum TaxID=2594430 RepID=UPI00117A2E2F|nr:HopJ type III effector protein [Flavobacterium franklandianum]TRX30034.1 HopJ type III effector protein [Flavobacterium franklandianum]
MNISSFLEKLKLTPNNITFPETIAVIEENYDFTPTTFDNGTQHNVAGENSGSCKLFAFAKLQNLSQAETLACFGAYYFEEVLENPEGTNHQNIRNFMKSGWDGIQFSREALTLKLKFFSHGLN